MAESTSDSTYTAFTGGRILTMNMEEPEAEVIVFLGSHIVAVGDREILRSFEGAEILNLNGRTLIPGFIDSHLHLSFGAFLPTWVDLNGCVSKEEILSRLKLFADTHPDAEWIIGFPWIDLHYGGFDISREDLDDVVSSKPVILIHTSFHSIVASTLACHIADIDKKTPDPDSGFILRREDGEISGVLIESACIPILRHALSISTEKYVDLIEQAALDLHQFGITAVHDPGVTPDAQEAYHHLYSEKRLPVSVLMMPHGSTLLDNMIAKRLEGLSFGEGDEQLRVGPVKVFGDGANEATTALSLHIGDQIISSGVYRTDFQNTLIESIKSGFQVCVHCLGNRTVDAVLETLESAKHGITHGFILRPRFEHLNLLSQTQISRLSLMNACASVQPQFLSRAGRLNKIPITGSKWFAYKDLMESGIVLGGSSDYPGGFMDARDVIACISMATTMSDRNGNRISSDQIMSFEKWLWIYTAGSAYIGNQESERGMLAKGLVADFVILDGLLDPHSPPVVDETWIGGKQVYCRSH